MMIEAPNNPFLVWIQTPNGSINILECRAIILMQTESDGKEVEYILFDFKDGGFAQFHHDDPLYADLKDQLIRSHFLRVGPTKPKLALHKPNAN